MTHGTGQNPFLRRIKNFQMFDGTGLSEEVQKGLRFVIYGVMVGMFCVVVTGGAAWTGFLRDVIHANDFQLGIIAAIPVAANTSQLLISYIMEKKRNRRFLFLFFGILGRIMWIPIGLIPYFVPEAAADLRVWLVIVMVAFVACGNSFVGLSFQSLLSDLVPMRIRGRYFSARQRMFLIVGIVAGLIVSFIVDATGTVGYTIVIVIAGISGVGDLCCFFFFKWPPMRETPPGEKQSGFFAMMGDVVRNKPFMRVVIFYTCWQFSLNVAAPFYNVHMLENLNMSYTQITLFNQITSNLITVFFVSRWGRLIDTHGNKPMMQLISIFVMLLPLMWVFITPGTTWLIVISNIISGLFIPIYDLGQQNLCLDQAGEKNTSMYLAFFFACINLLGIALGNAVGGYLVQDPFAQLAGLRLGLFGVTLNQYHYIFITTALLRVITVLVLLPMIREEGARPVALVAGELITGARGKWTRAMETRRARKWRRQARKEDDNQ